MSAAMRTDDFERTGTQHGAVFAHVIVIADAVETTTAMNHFQLFGRKRTVRTGGGAMNDDVIDFSHDN